MVENDKQKNHSNATFVEGRGGGQGKPRTPSGQRQPWQPPENPTIAANPRISVNNHQSIRSDARESERTKTQENSSGPAMNRYNTRFEVKLLGHGDPQPELQVLKESPFLQNIFHNTPIFRNRPCEGQRGPRHEFDVDRVVGFIVPGTAHYRDDGLHGLGIYATAEVLRPETMKFRSLMQTPFGLDITAAENDTPPHITVISIDVVVNPRGTGKIVGIRNHI